MKRIKTMIGVSAAVCCLASTSHAAFLFQRGFTAPTTFPLGPGAAVIAAPLASPFVSLPGGAGAAPGPVLPENTGAGTLTTSADWSGDVIGFDWAGTGIAPGAFGEVVIRTSLLNWTHTTASVIDDETASAILTYAAPEPATVIAGALLLLPFAASTIRIMRKRMA